MPLLSNLFLQLIAAVIGLGCRLEITPIVNIGRFDFKIVKGGPGI
jgi:hypothetical protein